MWDAVVAAHTGAQPQCTYCGHRRREGLRLRQAFSVEANMLCCGALRQAFAVSRAGTAGEVLQLCADAFGRPWQKRRSDR